MLLQVWRENFRCALFFSRRMTGSSGSDSGQSFGKVLLVGLLGWHVDYWAIGLLGHWASGS